MKFVRYYRLALIAAAICIGLFERIGGRSIRGNARTERARAVYAERPADPNASRVIDDNLVAYSTANQSIAEARQKSRETLPRFLEMWKSGKPGTYMLKFPLTQQGKTEHIWLKMEGYRDGKFQGRLDNEPANGNEYIMGQAMSVAESDIEDWMVKTPDGLYGGYVTRYAIKDMPEVQRRRLQALFRD